MATRPHLVKQIIKDPDATAPYAKKMIYIDQSKYTGEKIKQITAERGIKRKRNVK